MNTKTIQSDYYLAHSELSDPAEYAESYDAIPADLQSTAKTVQGLMLHDYFGALLYPSQPPMIATASRATLPISQRLPTFHEFGSVPLMTARSTSDRVIGTCRDFALLTCSILRHQGIAARVRCGFARYFHPPTYEDHWICEYWDTETDTWKKFDAQLDDVHAEHLSISFDNVDMPKKEFLYPWQIWKKHRHDLDQLEAFGHGEAKGFWFVRVNLVRDLLALMNTEVSRWDTWRKQVDDDKIANCAALDVCDQIAEAAKQIDTDPQIDPASFSGLVKKVSKPHWCER